MVSTESFSFDNFLSFKKSVHLLAEKLLPSGNIVARLGILENLLQVALYLVHTTRKSLTLMGI